MEIIHGMMKKIKIQNQQKKLLKENTEKEKKKVREEE